MTASEKFILLAEDDAVVAELVLHTLATLAPARKVIHVRDGVEALDFLFCRGAHAGRASGNPALVLLDMKMPRLDGLEVLRRVKTSDLLRTTPVVMLTSSTDDTDLTRSYEYGANAYVVKPVEFRKFAFVLQHLESFWLDVNHLPPSRHSLALSADQE